jgi:heme-degrading monooxygenase HmoA
MFAVIFEVEPYPDRWDDYLTQAATLRPDLFQIDGFLDNRRFSSRGRPGWLLSLSLWRDETAVIRWRTHAGHHAAQTAGRQTVFRDYHLRVGEVIRQGGQSLPRTRCDETVTGAARAISLVEAALETPPAGTDCDVFDGITITGSTLTLLAWPDTSAMAAWNDHAGASRLDVQVIRDYGLTDRREAPQFHAPVGQDR